MEKKFLEFLIERKAAGRFIKNADYPLTKVIDSLEKDPENAIDIAFRWDSTPEGQAYWEQLNYEWKESLPSKRIKYLVIEERPVLEVIVYSIDCLHNQDPIEVVKEGGGFAISRTSTISQEHANYTVRKDTEDN